MGKSHELFVYSAYWVILHAVLSADIFQRLLNNLSGISPVSNNLDPDKAQHFVGPDLHCQNEKKIRY